MQTRSTMMIAALMGTAMGTAALLQPAGAQTTTTTTTTVATTQTMAVATTPLNIRTGPGPEYPVTGSIPTNGQAAVIGCIDGSLWCQISYNGSQGWAYAQYLTGANLRALPPIAYSAPPSTTGTTVVRPTYSGEFVAPVATTTTTAPLQIAPPPPTVQTYIVQNPTPQVYLNGEVVEGAGLPPDVALAPVPDSTYSYAYVNGVRVLVEPDSRRVRYIYR